MNYRPDISIFEAVEDHIAYKCVHDWSEETTRSHSGILRRFAEFIGHQMPVRSIEKDDIRSFINEKHYPDYTKSNYTHTLNIFFSWCEDQGLIERN